MPQTNYYWTKIYKINEMSPAIKVSGSSFNSAKVNSRRRMLKKTKCLDVNGISKQIMSKPHYSSNKEEMKPTYLQSCLDVNFLLYAFIFLHK